MPKDFKKVPKKSLQFKEHVDNSAIVEFKAGDDEKEPTLVMKAHSGKPMDHWYHGKLAVDTSGVKFTGKRFPVLNEHWGSEKIGSSEKLILQDDHSLHLDSDSFQFVDTKIANDFISNSENGFPYQASISIEPTKVERLEKGAKSEVNGYTLTGPATILRESNYRETSVCVWGADSNTESKVGKFNEDEMIELNCELVEVRLTEEFSEVDNNKISKEESIVPDKLTLEELQEKSPELFDQVKEIGASEKQTDLKEETTTNKLTEVVEKLTDKVLKLEKAEMINTEKFNQKEQKDEAEKIYVEKFSEMNLRAEAVKKVRKLCNYKSFVKDGKFDIEKFTEALDTELKDWEDFINDEESEIHGGVSAASIKTSKTSLSKSIDEAIDDLYDSINFDDLNNE
jgi:hypothetical protein